MYARLRIAGIIPAFNEERLVGGTVATIPGFVDDVLVIDDGSTDRTIVRARAAGDDRLLIVRHNRNRGVGAAIISGYRKALRLGADVAVVLAGDGQMDPAEMTRLIEPIAAGAADFVTGHRLGHRGLQARRPAARRVGNHVLTHLTRLSTGDPSVQDAQCGYTAISRAALETLPLGTVWPRYGYPNDLRGLVRAAGLRVVERPVTPIYGSERSGIRPMSAIPTYSYVLARTWFRRHLS